MSRTIGAWTVSMIMTMKTSEILRANLAMLMQVRGWRPIDVAKRSGVSPRMVAYILDGERVPSIDIADQLAGAFGISGWQLIKASLPDDLLSSPSLADVLDSYCRANPEGRELIRMIAKREADHATKSNG